MSDSPHHTQHTFGKYVLIHQLARGGMGDLYLAKLPGPAGFEKAVVLKRIRARHVKERDYVDMFVGEGRLLANLSHPNIVHVYEMGEVDGDYFMAMEFIHGQSLRALLQRTRRRSERIPAALVIEIMRGVCDGLWYAHDATDMRGTPLAVVHRDLSPDNLMISYTGEPKLIDFGIAKSGLALHQTGLGVVKGKLKYMSPEQTVAQPLDRRSDIFTLGICLYEALTGMHPFASASQIDSVRAIQNELPQELMLHTPELAPFQPIIDKALAKSPSDRYPDCSDLRDALDTLLKTGQIIPHRDSLGDYLQQLFADELQQIEDRIHEADPSTSALIRVREFQIIDHAPHTVVNASTQHKAATQVAPVREVGTKQTDWNARWLAAGAVLAVVSLSVALGLAIVRPDSPDPVPLDGGSALADPGSSHPPPPTPGDRARAAEAAAAMAAKPESSAARLQECITRSGEFCGCDLIGSARTKEAMQNYRGAASDYARFLVQCPDAKSYLKIQTRMQAYLNPGRRSRDPMIGGSQNIAGPNSTKTVRP